MSEKKCKNCIYYNRIEDEGYNGEGTCHRMPPVFVVSNLYLKHKMVPDSMFPVTAEDSFCGEYQEKEKQVQKKLKRNRAIEIVAIIKQKLTNGIRPIRDEIAKEANCSQRIVSEHWAWKAYKNGFFDYLKKGK